MGAREHVAGKGPFLIAPLLADLAASGLPCVILMVDDQLQMPGAAPPPEWREVRLRTPAGMVTLSRDESGVSVVVFGNADPPLLDAQRRVAAALGRAAQTGSTG
jgi:hypothetical protein